MKNFDEKLDAYLRGDLDESSKSDFLNEVSQNPDLQNQFDFEKEMIEGIKEARILEIKGNLSSVPVSYQPGFLESLGSFKVAITSGIIIGLIGLGGYYFLSDDENVVESSIVENSKAEKIEPFEDNNKEVFQENLGNSNLSVQDKIEYSEESTDENTIEIINGSESQPLENSEYIRSEEVITEVETFDPSIIEPEDNFSSPSSLELKNAEKGETTTTLYESTTIERIEDGEHDFHYQFYNKKLFLYGSFGKSPYEIIELNSENGRQYFLYYDNNFYPLDRDRDQIGELKALNDSRLETKLKKLKD